MSISPSINHINIRTQDMARLVKFYAETLGFSPGYRPPFSSVGTWLYLGEQALIHLNQTDQAPHNHDPSISHFALSCVGLARFLTQLRRQGVPYYVRVVPDVQLHQVELFDPDGNRLEVLFSGDEAQGVNIEPYKWTH